MTIRDNYWANDDGLVIGFGTNKPATNVASKIGVAGVSGELTMEIVAKDLLAVGSLSVGDLQGAPRLPDDVIITGVDLIVTEVFAGSSGVLDVGTFRWVTGGNGTANSITTIDVDSIIDGEVITSKLANLGVIGTGVSTLTATVPTAVGASVGRSVEGSGDSIVIAPSLASGSFSGGKATLVVQYKQ